MQSRISMFPCAPSRKESAPLQPRSIQFLRIAPIFVLRIDLHLRQRLELALVERRHVGLRGTQRREMLFRLLQAPVIGVGRPVAPRGPVGFGGGVNGARRVAQGTESRLTAKRAEDLEQVLRIPGGSFSPPLDGSLVGGLSHQIEGKMADHGHVLGAVAGAKA